MQTAVGIARAVERCLAPETALDDFAPGRVAVLRGQLNPERHHAIATPNQRLVLHAAPLLLAAASRATARLAMVARATDATAIRRACRPLGAPAPLPTGQPSAFHRA